MSRRKKTLYCTGSTRTRADNDYWLVSENSFSCQIFSWVVLYIQVFCFMKVHHKPPCFYEIPTFALVFFNWKRSKDNFHLLVMKSENSVQRLFYRELLEAVHTPGSKSCLPQEPHSASQPQIARASNWVCELYHTLFWPSVNKMCPKISENPRRSYFSGLGMLKNFLIQVSGTCSLLYATLACLRVYSNTVG